jgi:hypothetical protein
MLRSSDEDRRRKAVHFGSLVKAVTIELQVLVQRVFDLIYHELICE